jgi:predicted TIM-barrel fold metal-dependent hydrolase
VIVDAHMHLWDHIDGRIRNDLTVSALRNGMIRIGHAEVLGMPAYMLDCAARAEYAVSEFDASGVDVGVVVQEYMDGAQNEYLRSVVTTTSDRFIAHALPDFWNVDQAAVQAKKLLAEGTFCGLKIPAGHLKGQVRLDDSRFMPIWDDLEQRELVLAVDLSDDEDQVPEMESILTRCPSLRVAIGHFGMVNRGGWPGQLRLARWKNVYLEMGGIIWLYRNEGYPFPGALRAIREAAAEVGVEKLMWGSDWPRTMVDFTYRQSLDFVRTTDQMDDRQKSLILGENARRLYRLPAAGKSRRPVAVVTDS